MSEQDSLLSLSELGTSAVATFGKSNIMTVERVADFGVFLDGGDLGPILLPKNEVKDPLEPGDAIKAFIHFDSDDRLIATTQTPKAELGQVALLKVSENTKIGAFIDNGIGKELLCPLSQQRYPLEVGRKYPFYVFQDEVTRRLTATTKFNHYISDTNTWVKPGQSIKAFVAEKTPLGYKCVVNNEFWAMIFKEDSPNPLKIGETVTATIKYVRKDGKITLWFRQEKGKDPQVDQVKAAILKALKENKGLIRVHDKSDPEVIRSKFRTSKARFKKAVGALLKEGKIETIDEVGIRLK